KLKKIIFTHNTHWMNEEILQLKRNCHKSECLLRKPKLQVHSDILREQISTYNTSIKRTRQLYFSNVINKHKDNLLSNTLSAVADEVWACRLTQDTVRVLCALSSTSEEKVNVDSDSSIDLLLIGAPMFYDGVSRRQGQVKVCPLSSSVSAVSVCPVRQDHREPALLFPRTVQTASTAQVFTLLHIDQLTPDVSACTGGVLQATINYTLTLDATRLRYRAHFKPNMRQLLGSVLVGLGLKCLSHPFEIPSCPEDSLSSLSNELQFSMTGLPSSSADGLSPILDPGSGRKTFFPLDFERQCGADEKCVDDLKVDFNFSRVPELQVGISPVLNLTVAVENRGEDSYNSRVIFTYPSVLSYRRNTLLQVLPRYYTVTTRLQAPLKHPAAGTPTLLHSTTLLLHSYNSRVIFTYPSVLSYRRNTLLQVLPRYYTVTTRLQAPLKHPAAGTPTLLHCYYTPTGTTETPCCRYSHSTTLLLHSDTPCLHTLVQI
ncbi:ITAX protein, partial [Atractosteus spatula]|nr:ITAX protein [Atractosteus spatula]